MNIELKKYTEQCNEWPQTGYHIMAQYDKEKIIVYQSYRPAIGNYAAKHQQFGGDFSLNRMTWIKPNFLWMMYRNGWATKKGQEVVLAIHLKIEAFEKYMRQSEYSSFGESLFEQHDQWKASLEKTEARLQWDPDHDPYGAKLERRAIQIGIKGELTRSYAQDDIIEIEDISDFVTEQREWVRKKKLEYLLVPHETPFWFEDDALNDKLKIRKTDAS